MRACVCVCLGIGEKVLGPKMVDEHVKLCTNQFPCDENLIEPHWFTGSKRSVCLKAAILRLSFGPQNETFAYVSAAHVWKIVYEYCVCERARACILQQIEIIKKLWQKK